MGALETALTQFVNHITQTAGVYATVIGIFVYHVVLHKDLPCTCKDQEAQCWLYLLLPVFFILFFVLWVDKPFQKTLTYSCKDGYKCHSCISIVKAVCIGVLWVVSVLLDGDWFICCHNKETDHQKLACKNKANDTAEEQRIRNQLAGKSMTDGLITLLFIIFVAAILSSIQENCKKKKNLLHRIIVEEGENLLETRVREAVKVKVMEKFSPEYKTWGESFDVIEEIRKGMLPDTPPTQVNRSV